jgi:hypothetical protein
VSGQHFIIQPMKRGERKIIKFKVGRDSGYKVHIIFESGTELVRTLGYVTSGFDFKDELRIEPTDITVKRAGS